MIIGQSWSSDFLIKTSILISFIFCRCLFRTTRTFLPAPFSFYSIKSTWIFRILIFGTRAGRPLCYCYVLWFPRIQYGLFRHRRGLHCHALSDAMCENRRWERGGRHVHARKLIRTDRRRVDRFQNGSLRARARVRVHRRAFRWKWNASAPPKKKPNWLIDFRLTARRYVFAPRTTAAVADIRRRRSFLVLDRSGVFFRFLRPLAKYRAAGRMVRWRACARAGASGAGPIFGSATVTDTGVG